MSAISTITSLFFIKASIFCRFSLILDGLSHGFAPKRRAFSSLHSPHVSGYHNRMIGRKGLLGGFIALFFFSIIVFFFIYFLAPEVSMRFFGIAFRQEEYVERSLEDAIVDMGIPEEEARGIVASLDSEEMRALVSSGSDYLKEWVGAAFDHIDGQTQEDAS